MHYIAKLKHSLKTIAGAILCAGILFTMNTVPAFAYDNQATDEIGAATTIYQLYREDSTHEEYTIDTNVPGKSPEIEQFIDNALNLATRILPFSYDASIQYYADTNPTTFFVTFRNRDYNDHNTEVQGKIAELAAQASALETDYEKLEIINDYLVEYCEYLSEAMELPEAHTTAFTAYGALIEGQAVCEGYTNAVQLYCEAVDIPCVKVTGIVDGGNHIWNAVYLENKWWMLDTTFNDPIGIQDENDRLRFFLIDMDTFAEIGLHTYDNAPFEISKMILMGRTTGQATPVEQSNLSAQNAEAQDKPNAALLRAEQQTTQANAEALHTLGVFFGDERGYRLEDDMTRVEMGAMILRINGGMLLTEEKDEAYYLECCPFTDVPDWAKSTIGYLYDNQLIAGQSETTFGTGPVSRRDYAVMLLRVLNIEHTYDNALIAALQNGLIDKRQINGEAFATRGDIVNMTYAAVQILEQQKAEAENMQDITTPSAYDTVLKDSTAPAASESPENEEDASGNTSAAIEDRSASESDAEKEDETTEMQTMPL